MGYFCNMTQGIFVNENGGIRYAQAIVKGIKLYETRSKNMLSDLIGLRVAIVRTHRNKCPMVVGYVSAHRYNWKWLEENRDKTLIPPGSAYDTPFRWVYELANAKECEPFPLPANAIRHGRSWCEF